MDPWMDAIIASALGGFLTWVVFAVSTGPNVSQGYTTNCGLIGAR